MVKVLLLEDDPGYRDIVVRVIRRSYPCAVTPVATEREAWEELARETFDLVLLDLNIDGTRCWETLKRAVGHPGKPVAIVFSCEDTRVNAECAVSLGAYTFLSKPFNFARLKATLDAALAGKHRTAREVPGTPAGGGDDTVASIGEGGDRDGAERKSRPGYFRIRLKEEFERTLRYKRNLTLALLALKDPEESENPLCAPHGGPAFAHALETVRSAVRSTDLVAPYGMNELSMLMPETRSEQVLARIGGLREKLQVDLAEGGGEKPVVAVWVGMASLPVGASMKPAIRHVRSPDEFLRMARLALYRARLDETSPVAIFGA
jgi:DNA-binding response OmpR family regulator